MKTLLDVGCGRGISTSFFVLHRLEYVACVEGSHDAVTSSLLTDLTEFRDDDSSGVRGGRGSSSAGRGRRRYELIEHDFSRGPWWPSRTVDVAWCVEFTEHVGRCVLLLFYCLLISVR